MTSVRIALLGDQDLTVTAHRAIPLALALAGQELGVPVVGEWVGTETVAGGVTGQLGSSQGVWAVPATPYRSEGGALLAIRFARERRRPFLGTCGGFQHAMLEYARDVWGLAAVHAEIAPAAEEPVISPLACGLVEVSGEVFIVPGSRLHGAYGAERAAETYHCRYGFNPKYEHRLSTGPLRVSARDERGEIRAVELAGHPFFLATLFQPERAALAGRAHPVVTAFVAAAARTAPESALV